MHRPAIVAFALVGSAAILIPATAAAQQDTSASVLALASPGMAAVRVERGLRYRDTLTLDVHRAPGHRAGEVRPAIVFVPGGLVARTPGTSPTTWPFYRSWGRLAAVSGFVGVTINHRLTTDDNVVEAESDVRAALAHVRANAERYGIDRDRLCVAFYSAGGEIAAAALHEPPPWLRCVLLFYPFLDLEHKRVRSPFRDAQPASHVDSLVPRYSPTALLRADPAGLPPIFLAMAGRDAIAGITSSIEHFVNAAMAHRVPLTLMVHPTGAHGFDQRNHDARSVEILEAALEFIALHTAR